MYPWPLEMSKELRPLFERLVLSKTHHKLIFNSY